MGSDGIELCQYCGGQLQPGTSLLVKADSEGFIGYCADSPEQGHRAAMNASMSENGSWIKAGTITAGTITAEMIDEAYWEQQRRAMFRQIADTQAVRGEWHEGTCSGCGLDDLPVIGLPGSEYCTYCEQLRVMVPVPEAQEPVKPAAPVSPSQLYMAKSLICTFAAFVATVISFFVSGDWITNGALVLFIFGFYYALRT